MDKLLIQKIGLNFWHRRNDLPLSDRNISDFEVSIDQNFVIVELDGSKNFIYKIENVSIQVNTGIVETFTDKIVLIDRLTVLGYTPYLNSIGLTPNQLLAIQGANLPSQTNVFATIADVKTNNILLPLPFGVFKWEKRGTNHTGQTPIAGDIFSGMISATEKSDFLVWNGQGTSFDINNLLNFNIVTFESVT